MEKVTKSAMSFALLKRKATKELVGVPKNKIRVYEKNKIWLSTIMVTECYATP